MNLTDKLRPILNPTGLTGGGATNLDGIVTLSVLSAGQLALARDGNLVTPFRLAVATTDESSPTTVRPDDYATTTNEKVWNLAGFQGTRLSLIDRDSGTNDIVDFSTINRRSSGTPAAGFGAAQVWKLQSSTTADQEAGRAEVSWVDATHASRSAGWSLKLTDSGSSGFLGLSLRALTVGSPTSREAALGIGTIPARSLHIKMSNSAGLTAAAYENSDTTDGNSAAVSFRTTTTGGGGASFQDMGGFSLTFTTHDHATRTSKFGMVWANSATFYQAQLIGAGTFKIGPVGSELQVLKQRITGWTLATGTPKRDGFATGTVTLPELAGVVMALLEDLHATAGHGLIGT